MSINHLTSEVLHFAMSQFCCHDNVWGNAARLGGIAGVGGVTRGGGGVCSAYGLDLGQDHQPTSLFIGLSD